MEIITTSLRVGLVAFMWIFLLIYGKKPRIREAPGLRYLTYGFGLLLLGSVVDLLEDYPGFPGTFFGEQSWLNYALEEVIGYCLGTTLLFAGFLKWFPMIMDFWKTEKVLQAERVFSTGLVNDAPVIICGMDKDGTITFINPEGERITGYTGDKVIGRNWLDVFAAGEEPSRKRELFSELANGRARNSEIGLTAKGGLRLVISWNSIRHMDRERNREEIVGFGIDVTARNQVESALRKSESRCRALFDQASDGIIVMSDKGIAQAANPAMTSILGYTEEEIVGRHVLEFIPADDLERLPDQWSTILEGDPMLFDRVMQAKDGTRRTLEVSAKRLEDDMVQCIYRDVTKRKLAEANLRESERLYRSLFQDSAISLWLADYSKVLDRLDEYRRRGGEDLRSYFDENPEAIEECIADLRIVDVNRKCLDLFAAKDREDFRARFPAIRPKENCLNFKEGLLAMSEGKTFLRTEVDYMTFDGRRLHCIAQFNVVPGYEDTLERVIVSLDDITERKLAETALRRSEERYRNIFENAPVGIFRTTLEGTYLSINPEGARMYGYDSPEDMMNSINDIGAELYDDPELRRELIRLCRERGEVREYEFLARSKNGHNLVISMNANALLDANGEMIGFDGFNTDVTLRKAAEQELRKLSSKVLSAQENERKRIGRELHDGPGQMLSALKILLKNQIELLHVQAPEADISGLEKTLAYIEESIVEIRRILLDLRPAMLDDLGLAAALEWLCREFETRYNNIRVDHEIDIDEGEVDEARRTVLYRVLQEALSNVAKHSSADRVTVSLIQHNGMAKLAVRDNGAGFDPRSNMEGIGLAGMRERIEAVSGKLLLQAKKGTGVLVRVEIPL